MRVLVACEYSGRVRQAFRDLGHDAWSCDLLPSDDDSEFHFQGDVTDYIGGGIVWSTHENPFHWDLLIAHPPCTRLCNSGVRWLAERDLWDDMREGAKFFNRLLNAPIPMVAVENPVMHKYAREIVGRRPDFTVQPWQFGDPAKKRTCFWTRGLPALTATSDMTAADATADCHLASPGPDRWKQRSMTYQGIANAIAAQWGGQVLERTG